VAAVPAAAVSVDVAVQAMGTRGLLGVCLPEEGAAAVGDSCGYGYGGDGGGGGCGGGDGGQPPFPPSPPSSSLGRVDAIPVVRHYFCGGAGGVGHPRAVEATTRRGGGPKVEGVILEAIVSATDGCAAGGRRRPAVGTGDMKVVMAAVDGITMTLRARFGWLMSLSAPPCPRRRPWLPWWYPDRVRRGRCCRRCLSVVRWLWLTTRAFHESAASRHPSGRGRRGRKHSTTG